MNQDSKLQEIINKPELNFWIPIIASAVGIAIAWGIMSNRVNSLEERFNFFGGRFQDRQELVDARLKEQDTAFLEIKVKLAEIQKDILFIKEQVK